MELSQGNPEPFPGSSEAQMDLSAAFLESFKVLTDDQSLDRLAPGGAVTSNTANVPSL